MQQKHLHGLKFTVNFSAEHIQTPKTPCTDRSLALGLMAVRSAGACARVGVICTSATS
jgi:hypothetical protein